jgi:hypothetical protein
MPGGSVSHSMHAPPARAPRHGAAGPGRPGERKGRALGVCALAASILALAAGSIQLGVVLILAAQIAFAASLCGRAHDRASRRLPAPTADRGPEAPWHALARPASVWRPSPGEWPAEAPDVELSLN